MNSGFNGPAFLMPALAVESFCQQSMYQQHTYENRNRMAVTDVFVQEHVSQSTWTMSAPPMSMPMRAPVFVQTGRGPFMGGNSAPAAPPPPHPSAHGRFRYMPTPGVPHYATSSASMNTYGQTYMQHSTASANVGGMYSPRYHPAQTTRPHRHNTRDSASQTGACVKRSCDATTQTEHIGDAPSMIMYTYRINASDSMESTNSRSSFESYGVPCVHQGDRRNSEVTLPIQRLQDITRIALKGSDIAERLANAHRQRPCFKKMDTLCARLKQDLLRPDGVLPNINSQGIAWAVKDFIFVFTRIVNSWVILKGYVYNTPNGLNKIKDELPGGFMAAFDIWQITTLTLVEMIIKSFVNLDGMLQKQKNSFCKVDIGNNGNINNSGNSSNSNNNNNWSSNGSSSDSNSSNKTLYGTDIALPVPTPVHLTHESRRGPSAYSTPYNSMKHSNNANNLTNSFSESQPESQAESSSVQDDQSKCSVDLNYLYTMVQDSEEAQRCVNANGTYLKTGTYTPLKRDTNTVEQTTMSPQLTPPMLSAQNLANIWKNSTQSPDSSEDSISAHTQLKSQNPKLKTMIHCRHNDSEPYSTSLNQISRDVARKLYEMSNRIMQLQHIDRFFQKQFTRNYFPYFFERCQNEFIDVRAIILKCESATYQHIYQAIHDMRRIIYLVHNDLKDHTNMELRLYTALYERSINEMLTKPPYHPQQFQHITGQPGEKLFN